MFAPHDVGTTQASVMRELGRVGHASQASLARTIVQDPAALARAIDVLEARGWVRRIASTADRRQKEVRLTDEGERAVERIDESYAALTTRIDAALTAEERELFASLADKMIAALAPGAEASAEVDP